MASMDLMISAGSATHGTRALTRVKTMALVVLRAVRIIRIGKKRMELTERTATDTKLILAESTDLTRHSTSTMSLSRKEKIFFGASLKRSMTANREKRGTKTH